MEVIKITSQPMMTVVSQGDNNVASGSRSSDRSWDED